MVLVDYLLSPIILKNTHSHTTRLLNIRPKYMLYNFIINGLTIYIDRRTRTCVVPLLQELLDGGDLLLGRARLLLLGLVILDGGLGSGQNHLYNFTLHTRSRSWSTAGLILCALIRPTSVISENNINIPLQ